MTAKKQNIARRIGGNTGDIPANFRMAFRELASGGLSNIVTSKFYRTAPVGCPPGAGDFVNGALTGIWDGSPLELLDLCKKIEEMAGRPAAHDKNSDRPLDLDIILFGDMTFKADKLSIPHSEAAKRLFVMLPLADVASSWPFPGQGGRTVSGILSCLASSDQSAYRAMISSVMSI